MQTKKTIDTDYKNDYTALKELYLQDFYFRSCI